MCGWHLACQSKSRINGVVGSQNDEGLFSDETLFEKKNLENLKHFYFDWQAKIYESARASELQKIFFRWNWISFSHPLEAFNKNFESKIEQTSKMMLTAKYIFSEEYKLMKWYLVKSNSFSLARCYVDKRLMFLFFSFLMVPQLFNSCDLKCVKYFERVFEKFRVLDLTDRVHMSCWATWNTARIQGSIMTSGDLD